MKNEINPPDRTEIAFILDRSGSMESCRDAAIDGFNQFLREQQQAKGSARLTLVFFDDEYVVPVSSIPIAEVVSLNRETYTTGNTTALLDAVGRTIDELGARLAAIGEPDRPGQIIVAILTDGLENASRRSVGRRLPPRSNTRPRSTGGPSCSSARTRTRSLLRRR